MARTRKKNYDNASSVETSTPGDPATLHPAGNVPSVPDGANQHSSKSKTKRPTAAYYNEDDLDKMVSFLVERAAEAGDGGNFTKNVWNDLALHLNRSLTSGGPKTADSVKNKFGTYFRKEWNIIQVIISKSGWPAWTDDGGANIPIDEPGQAQSNLSVSWDEFVRVKPHAAPYRNAGWAYFSQMQRIMPTASATGRHVYRASQEEQDDSVSNFSGSSDSENEPNPPDEESKHTSPSETTPAPILQLQPPTPPPTSQHSDPKQSKAPAATANTKQLNSKRKGPDTPSTPRTDQKRPALSASVTRPLTGAQAIADMTGAVREWNSTASRFFDRRPAYPASPERKALAISSCLELEDHLCQDEILQLINIFEHDSSKANAYLALKDARSEIRTGWVQLMVSQETRREMEDFYSA